ncbi:hypothetical protein CK214_28230 [Mesorhizobium sp. WSM3882]|nr:hypothetical protein CK214_28230 [Mesorhizobium sp. WSM3882]
MTLSFMHDAANLVFIGPNGVGKSTLARNVAHQALICGHTVLFRTASEMLGELAPLTATQRAGGAAGAFFALCL